MSNLYPTTESWQTNFNKSEKENPNETVFHKIEPVRQEESYSCGTAALASVLKSHHIETSDQQLIEIAKDLLAKKNLEMEETGTPPDVMKQLLELHNIPFEEKKSDPNSGESFLVSSEKWLKNKLDKGYVCITPIQTTPEYWVRNIKTGEIAPEAVAETEEEGKVRDDKFNLNPNYEIVYTPADAWKDYSKAPEIIANADTKTPDMIAATTRQDVTYNGHYVVVVGYMKSGDREFFITADPMYKWWTDDIATINPEYSGYRFVERKIFMRNWHDISAENEPFNQYGLAIKLPE